MAEIPARNRWRSLNKGNQQKPRAVWDQISGQVLAFIFDDDKADPVAAVVIAPLQEPHENDIRVVQILCRVFNEDLRTAPDALTQSELWEVLSETRFSRSIGRFTAFSTLPFMHWLRTIQSALHLRYEGTEFSANIFMAKQRKWILKDVKTFVPFSQPLNFENVLLREKWVRSLACEAGVGLVGLGHTGSIIGLIAIPRRESKSIFPPHRALSGVVSLVRPGTMAFICAPNADLYVVLPNGAIFLMTQGRWHYLNYSSFRNLLGQHISAKIVDSVFRVILDLSFQRRGALLCFLEDSKAISRIVPDYGRSNSANEALRKSVRNLDIRRVAAQPILLAAAGVDGAMFFSTTGRVLDAACMIGDPDVDALTLSGCTQLNRLSGARSTAAWNASTLGLSIKVSEDGPVTVYKFGKLIGQMA